MVCNVHGVCHDFSLIKYGSRDADVRQMRTTAIVGVIQNEHIPFIDVLIFVKPMDLVNRFQQRPKMHGNVLSLGNRAPLCIK